MAGCGCGGPSVHDQQLARRQQVVRARSATPEEQQALIAAAAVRYEIVWPDGTVDKQVHTSIISAQRQVASNTRHGRSGTIRPKTR